MIGCFLFISLLIHSAAAAGNPSTSATKKWLTLDGQAPVVVARGGFSGMFPESSDFANQMAVSSTYGDVVLLCNLQMTKDGLAICLPDVRLDNTTNIAMVFPNQSTTYNVNGHTVTGWFSFDYTGKELYANVSLVQETLSRPDAFDLQYPISGMDSVFAAKAPATWINVQYDQIYTQHKLNMVSLITDLGLQTINYISSPEIGYLKAMQAQVSKTMRARTKLFFVFLDKDETEPTTNQTYGSILGNLASIKPFVSGIVVPKEYIWPMNAANYLDAPTSLVNDAHKQGLQVFVNGFKNDAIAAYNYSYDPSAEYLQFIDNSQFSVDGLITDFPPTAKQVVSCFAAYNATMPRKGQPLIITLNGASGVYTGSTDLAYQQAIKDGADVIDCSVQISQDGVAFCMDSIDLTANTNAITMFMSRSTSIPEIQQSAGIFSFDLSSSEIQTLQPQLMSPFGASNITRNPAYKNAGKFLTLAEFLELAKAKAVSGILINMKNAAYLASKKGLDIVTAVSSALTNATFDQQATQQVLIQSDDTSVLSKFRNVPAYKRVLFIDEEISDAPRKPVEEIKKYADAVTLTRYSIIPTINGFTEAPTKAVKEMHAANLSVYVSVLRNEFVSLAYDFYADPTMEIATYAYAESVKVDGIVTEFPATATRFFRNPCSDVNNDKLPFTILPIDVGSLLTIVPPETLPPASAPRPALDVGDVVDPPLPAVAKDSGTDSSQAPAAPHSGALARVANVGFSVVVILVLGLLAIGN